MCGIVGYCGTEQAAPILLEGLSKLEYRGYDSAGLAVRNNDGTIEVVKAKGRLEALIQKTNAGASLAGSCGIGHTRWATHGEPSENNAHPHLSDDGNIVAVHNGIIENYTELKDKLIKKGYSFYSETDTEVIVKLIDYYYKKYNIGPIDAIAKTMVRVRGSYALAVMFKECPGQIWVARKDSPLIIGTTADASFVASDVPAILKYSKDVYYIGNLEMACLEGPSVKIYNLDGEQITKELTHITWDAEAAEKGGYEHFMIKEIHEQPAAVRDTLGAYIFDNAINLEKVGISDEMIKNINSIVIVGCGSAYHVGVVGQYVIEKLCRVPVRVELASEFRYRNPILHKNDLVIAISQSGETADTLAAVRQANEQGCFTLGIVNVVGSSIARETSGVMYTLAGPEIAVATTKAYSAQLVAVDMLALWIGKVRETLSQDIYEHYIEELSTIPDKMTRIFEDNERIQWFTSKFSNVQDAFFIGRGIDYAISLEGSLKMKEISYVHSEAYAAGELKHGTISLIENGTLVIGILTQSDLFEKTRSNLVEVKSRGGYLMGVTNYGNYSIEDLVDFTIYIPKTEDIFAESLAIIPLQLMGYYMSVAKGIDVDKPRNLAKSVTVE